MMASTLAEETTDLTLPELRQRRPLPERVARRAPHVRPARRAVPGWEWILTVIALLVLTRSPVLFYRERVGELFGAGRAFYIWQDDAIVRSIIATVLFSMYVLAARRCRPRSLLRHPFLIAFVAMAFASVSWSIEPTVSMWRVMLFTGTAVAGWYLGERYTARELVGIVGATAAIGALLSILAIGVWPEKARSTNRVAGLWSGVYVNRNLLALAMATGLLSLPFLWTALPKRRRPFLILVGGLELFLLVMSGSRTPLIALGAAGAVGLSLVIVRKATTRALKPFGGAFAVGIVAGYVGLVVQWNWETIVRSLGRRLDLTRRTLMWAIDRYYSDMHPWKGWGFEAIWAHPPTIGVAQEVFGRFPYSSHSGYYEVLLSTGRIGLFLFVGFLAMAAWRAFRFAWDGFDAASIWPLVFLVFVAVSNVSESLFVSSEASWALTVAAAVAATNAVGRRRTLS
jgi:O-antigen ligase